MFYLRFIQEADCHSTGAAWILMIFCTVYAITQGCDLPINLWNKEYELGLPGK